jgi:alkylhydroperoxidase/carboxymuconolactone decarboxylase family protein YurZ
VLGEAWVNNALKNSHSFNKPFQELVTEYCWGAVWGREELPKKTRSMLNLAMISILNRPHELKIHIKGALTNGVSRDEIREIFMQVSIYAGIPAGVDSFRIAREVFAELDRAETRPKSPRNFCPSLRAKRSNPLRHKWRNGLLRRFAPRNDGARGNTTMELGFIGLGKMGFPMARRLIEAKHQLTVFDTRKEATDKLVALGAKVASSPKDIADRCETVLASLPSLQASLEVATGTGGVIEGKRVKRFVDLSTVGSQMAAKIHGLLAKNNLVQIDSPVSGGVGGAEKGTLAVMVSGPRWRR